MYRGLTTAPDPVVEGAARALAVQEPEGGRWRSDARMARWISKGRLESILEEERGLNTGVL
jgi:hypothetical protein